MVARGVRSRALRAHPFSDRLYSAAVRYDDHRRRNWFYRSLSLLGRGTFAHQLATGSCAVIPLFHVKALP
jgi:hypothetical protein